jgi:hypothetical protein
MYEEYADKKAAALAETDIVILDEEVCIADAARAMRKKGILSVLVIRTSQRISTSCTLEAAC